MRIYFCSISKPNSIHLKAGITATEYLGEYHKDDEPIKKLGVRFLLNGKWSPWEDPKTGKEIDIKETSDIGVYDGFRPKRKMG